MKPLKTILISLALVVGAAAACEACMRLGSAAVRVDIERTVTR